MMHLVEHFQIVKAAKVSQPFYPFIYDLFILMENHSLSEGLFLVVKAETE